MRFLCFFLLFLATAANAQKNRLDVTPVAPGCWVHTTYGKYRDSYIPGNGLIVEGAQSVWLVDTGWGEKSSRKLLRWIKKHLHKPVALVFISHAHDDRAGGIAVFQKRRIPVYMTPKTAELLQKEGVVLSPYQALAGKSGEISRDGLTGEWLFPGHGHAPDNIVLYFRAPRLLFGGCFIRSMVFDDLGNLSDASVTEWPAALRSVQSQFPEMRIVIPGHEAWGGPELLEHTLKLLATAPQ